MVHLVKAMVFPLVMSGCESWTVKKAEHWRTDALFTVVLEKTLESPLDCKEIQPVHPKEDQSWVFSGRNDATVETPVLWPPHAKSWLIGKDSDAGRDWGQEEKGTTEDEMTGWHNRLDGCEFVWTLGIGDGQGGLVCCNSWGCKESDTTERLNWTELNVSFFILSTLQNLFISLSKSIKAACFGLFLCLLSDFYILELNFVSFSPVNLFFILFLTLQYCIGFDLFYVNFITSPGARIPKW